MGFRATETAPINGERAFTIELWSKRPPTREEVEAAGGTIGVLDFPRTIAANITPNKRDIGFIPSRDSAHTNITPTKRKHNVRLFEAEWASQLYVVRTMIDGEKVRIFTIARVRGSNALWAFTRTGKVYKHIKWRKHVNPHYVRKALDIDDSINITVDCVQLDAIRNARNEHRSQKRVTIPNLPITRSASLRVINENAEDIRKREERERKRAEQGEDPRGAVRDEYGIDEDMPTVDTVGYVGCTDCSRLVHATRPTHEERAATLEKRRRNIEARKRALAARHDPVKPVLD